MSSKAQSKSIPSPGYVAQPPVLRPVQDLRKYGGQQGAAAQLTQLALLHLEEYAAASGNGIRVYIQAYGAKHGHTVGLDDFASYRQLTIEPYIVQTHQVADRFLEELNSLYRSLKSIPDENWVDTDKQKRRLPPLQQYAQNILDPGRKLIKAAPEFEILEYYRLVRNWIVHKSDATLRSARAKHASLSRLIGNYPGEVYGLPDALTGPETLKFSDFYLFTRSLQYFANLLNNAAMITLDDITQYFEANELVRAKFKQHGQSKTIRRRFISSMYRLEFKSTPLGAAAYLQEALDSRFGIKSV